MSNATKTAKRSDFKKYFQFMWRSLNIQASWNYERQMNMGFLYGIAPTLDELYPNENDPEQLAHKKEAYEREMAFYNCTPQTSAFTLGLAASMEEQYAADRENFNPETINAVKTSLMGPPVRRGRLLLPGHCPPDRFWSGHLSGTAGQRSGPHSGYDHLHRPLCAGHMVCR